MTAPPYTAVRRRRPRTGWHIGSSVALCVALLPFGLCADPSEVVCSSASAISRDCRPAAGSADDNAPQRVLRPGGPVVVPRSIRLNEMHAGDAADCAVRVSLEYGQRHESIDVTARIENSVCAASQGELTLHVRTAGVNGVQRTRRFVEPWSRATADTVVLPLTYPMDGDVDLVRVFSRTSARTGCRCTAAGDAASAPDAAVR